MSFEILAPRSSEPRSSALHLLEDLWRPPLHPHWRIGNSVGARSAVAGTLEPAREETQWIGRWARLEGSLELSGIAATRGTLEVWKTSETEQEEQEGTDRSAWSAWEILRVGACVARHARRCGYRRWGHATRQCHLVPADEVAAAAAAANRLAWAICAGSVVPLAPHAGSVVRSDHGGAADDARRPAIACAVDMRVGLMVDDFVLVVAADVHDPECVDVVPAVRLVTCPWVHARAQQPRLSPA